MKATPTRYTDPRAHELRERYLAAYGGDEFPVPVEKIAEDLLGLQIEEDDLGECSLDAGPHELGHWICQAHDSTEPVTPYCRHLAGWMRVVPSAVPLLLLVAIGVLSV